MKTIKNLLSIAALALVGAMMTGCSSEDKLGDTPTAGKGNVETQKITVNLDGKGSTRALTAAGEKTFAVGDKIAVSYTNTSNETVKAVSTELTAADITDEGKTATFTVSLTSPKAGTAVTYIYPAAMAKDDGTVNYDALATQDGTLAKLASNFDLATGTSTGTLSDTGALPTTAVTLTNPLAILAITVKDDNGTTDVTTDDEDITNTITSMSVDAGSNTYNISGHDTDGHIYVAIKPTSSADITVTATAGTITNYYKALTEKTYVASNGYPLTLTMGKRTDLSIVDCAGNDRATTMTAATRTTANCYMVHTAGDYMLPLVYGNAIKNGEDNTLAYKPGGTASNTYTTNFVNHAGNAIDAPWITKSDDGTGVNKGMDIAVKKAELLWQDAQGLITAVGIAGNYLTLTVGNDASAQEGNAVIAAELENGTIVWSWHIWVTKQKFDNLTTITTGTTGTQGVDWQVYKVTPVNLGWVSTGTGDNANKQGYNTYYQWGRKDAFIPSTGTGNTNHTVYNIENGTVTGFTAIASTSATIGTNIKNPTTHYYNNSSTYGPCNTTYYNMWDAQNTETDNVATATKKTVYDPCPPGFCVPTGNLYYFMGSGEERPDGNWDDTNKGKTWKQATYSSSTTGPDLYFPASGHRSSSSSGTLSDVGSYGCYWSASPHGIYDGRYLRFHSELWYWSNRDRAYGYPVRAVAEEVAEE